MNYANAPKPNYCRTWTGQGPILRSLGPSSRAERDADFPRDPKPKCVWLLLALCLGFGMASAPETACGQVEAAKPSANHSPQTVDDAQPAQPVDEVDLLDAVSQRMNQVQKLLVQGQTAAETQQIQRDIIADLQRLLDQQSENQSQSQSNAEQQKQDEQAVDSELSGKTGRQESEPTEGTDQAATAEQTVLSKEFQDRIWGHLPDRLRDQMRNSEVEKFLPKYEQLIRAYYRRLAAQLPDR